MIACVVLSSFSRFGTCFAYSKHPFVVESNLTSSILGGGGMGSAVVRVAIEPVNAIDYAKLTRGLVRFLWEIGEAGKRHS